MYWDELWIVNQYLWLLFIIVSFRPRLIQESRPFLKRKYEYQCIRIFIATLAIEKIYRKWDRVVSSNFIFTQKMGMLMLHNKYHSHWWPGDAKPLADILLNYVLRNIPVSAPVVVNWGLSGNKRPQPSMHWCIVVASSTNSMTVLMLAWRIIIQWGH